MINDAIITIYCLCDEFLKVGVRRHSHPPALPLEEDGAAKAASRGYTPSKRRYFYGLRAHLVVTGTGEPVAFALTVRLGGRREGVQRLELGLTRRLDRRERELLEALAEGLSDREIAERLYVGVGTVRSHMTHILAKLGVDSRLQALLFAIRHGLVEIDRPLENYTE